MKDRTRWSLSLYVSRSNAWIRVGRLMVSVRNHRLSPPLFSERSGRRPCFHLGRFGFQYDFEDRDGGL